VSGLDDVVHDNVGRAPSEPWTGSRPRGDEAAIWSAEADDPRLTLTVEDVVFKRRPSCSSFRRPRTPAASFWESQRTAKSSRSVVTCGESIVGRGAACLVTRVRSIRNQRMTTSSLERTRTVYQRPFRSCKTSWSTVTAGTVRAEGGDEVDDQRSSTTRPATTTCVSRHSRTAT